MRTELQADTTGGYTPYISLKLIMNHPIAHSNPPGFQILRQCYQPSEGSTAVHVLQVGSISMEIKIVLLSSRQCVSHFRISCIFFAQQTFQKGKVSSTFWFTSNWFELFKRFFAAGKALSVAVDDWQCLSVLSVFMIGSFSSMAISGT